MNAPSARWFAIVIDYSLLLVAGAVGALVWANIDLESYEHLAHLLHFAVNDIGMVFFFALAAKEVFEATLPGGALASPRHAAVPLLAAAGGMVAPALIYTGFTMAAGRPDLTRGWAIPCATDIAFSYLVARLIFGGRHPAIPFLLLLAIADDALGLVILAVFYPTGEVRPVEFAVLLAAAFAIAWWMRRWRVRSFWPYVLCAGAVSWVALFRGGLHPALALVPIVPFMPHARRDAGFMDHADNLHDTLSEFEHWWRVPVQIILFFFGLANAGVPLASVGVGTWAVLTGIIAGKPIGILLFTLVAVSIGLLRPAGVSWRDLAVVGVIAAIGFTVALFFATAAFPPGESLSQAKMGAVLSFSAAVLSIAAAAVLRVGRFAPVPSKTA